MKAVRVSPYIVSLLVWLILALLLLFAASPVRGAPPAGRPYVSGRILVQYRRWAGPADRAALHRALGGRPVRAIAGIEVEVVAVPEGEEPGRAAAYARSPQVAYAEPDYVIYALARPAIRTWRSSGR